MNDFITLSCKSCGGKLQITPEIDDFACMYCGTEFKVKRGGGIVALAPLVEEMKKVSESTDKTASELAIARIRDDLTTLHNDQKNAEKKLRDLERREDLREDLISEIKSNRNSKIFIIASISFAAAFIFSVIIDLGFIVCTGIAITILGFSLYFVYNKNFRDITGRKRLQRFDEVTENIAEPLMNNIKSNRKNINTKKLELEKHEKIVGG